ncbi:MAG: polysaccharide deacetylase family protein [Bacteroidota bacterium]
MSLLEKLGYSGQKKLLIVHADDAGLSRSENKATIAALEFGVVNSYSIMTPCKYFSEIAAFSKANPNVDVGIHLTVTSEWDTYKVRPILPIAEIESLVDGTGAFHNTIETFRSYAIANHVEKELRAQIEKALTYGLAPSHLDSHMFALAARPDLLDIYRKLGWEYQIPVLLDKYHAKAASREQNSFQEETIIIVDAVYIAPFLEFEPSGLINYYQKILDNLSSGLNVILIHPAYDDHEMQHITKGRTHFGAKWRQIDLEYFTSNDCLTRIKNNNISLTTWREVSSRYKLKN